ncbi:PD-(D/E)XK nuclease family transposase [Arcicella gelida]
MFYDRLTYIYLEMPNFKQTETDLQIRLDKWLYFIKHLEDFQTIPTIIQK